MNRIDDEKSSMKGFTSFLEVLWTCSAIDEGKVLLDIVDSWDKTMELNGFAILTPLRTSGFSCSRTCATETQPAHPRSFLQDCCAWLHFWCAASALRPHQ
jgi:hypothetical protein